MSSSLGSDDQSLFDVSVLKHDLAVSLPFTEQAHVAMRHLHTLDLNGYTVTVAIPARLFDSDAFVPYTRRHSQSVVDQARNLLCFTNGAPVPGSQKFHVLHMTSNQRSLDQSARACAAQVTDSVDLICTMPVHIRGARLTALVDTASNHSIVTAEFLSTQQIPYTSASSVSTGISGSSAPCLGTIQLPVRVGRQTVAVKFTVVASLPSAKWHAPNHALLGLDVIAATQMKIQFEHSCIRISVPCTKPRQNPRKLCWQHVIHLPRAAQLLDIPSSDHEYVCTQRQLKSMVARADVEPLYLVHVKPAHTESTTCAQTCSVSNGRKGYLAQQQAPAPTPQDVSSIPAVVQSVISDHSGSGGTLGPVPANTTARGFEMSIDTLPGARPRAARQYRLTPVEQSELEKQVKHLLEMGWIQPSVSPWASSILFAPKPGGKLRLCIDYRYLNDNTVKNTYPLPRIDTLLDQLKGHKYFSALDLASGYHQIRVAADSQHKTAFRTPDGLYQWKVMPFGLTNAPSVFQQAMHVVLAGLIGRICLAYLDDIIILSRTAEEHARHLDTVLTRLHSHNFFCNLSKCQFAMTEIKYLGHVVTADTVKPDPHKVEVLQSWPVSDLQKSVNNVRSFLGLAGYFRRFIPKFPTLAAPLLEHIKSSPKLAWTPQCTQAFSDVKQALINATGMRHPDLNRSFHLYTDASDYAYGAVLMQTQSPDSSLLPVAWIGRKMNSSEVHHATFEKELGAIVFAARQWRCYLENNQPVYIHTDHNPLKYLQTQQRLNGKQARWVESLSRINWHIAYVPGDKNVVADAVSRATHLECMTVRLHDETPITCTASAAWPFNCGRSYPAVTLMALIARRSPVSPSRSGDASNSMKALSQSSATFSGPARTASAATFPLQSATAFPAVHYSSQRRGRSSSARTAAAPLLDDQQFPALPRQQTATTLRPPCMAWQTQPSEQTPRDPRGPMQPLPASIPVRLNMLPHLRSRASAGDAPRRTAPTPPPCSMPTCSMPASTGHPPSRQMQTPQCWHSTTSRTCLSAARSTPANAPLPTSQSEVTPAAAGAAGWLPEDDDLVADDRAHAALARGTSSARASLQAQSDKILTLDLRVDDFWARLRRGYACDPVFSTPPPSYRFDTKLGVYFHENKLVVPDHDHLRRQVLLWHHVHPWHAHMGAARTAALVTDSFFWPNIHRDIRTFVSQCNSCQTMKSPSAAEAVLSPLPVPSSCWRVVSLDMITQLPCTADGLDCVVVFVCQFSKMVRLIPTDSKLDGPGFAKLFFQQVYPHYGLPLGLCSDRGVQWNNKFFASLCSHLGIELRLTFSYHPRANGQAERLNRVVEEAIRHFVGPSHDDWDTFLPHVEFSINSSRNESTGCTPFSLNRLTPPLSPTALAFNLPQSQRPPAAVLHRMYLSLAKQSLEEAKQSMWNNFNQRAAWPVFRVGDNVLLSIRKIALHHPSLRKKFSPRWIGPCKITELVGRAAARVQLPSTLRQLNIHEVFHFSVLKLYCESHAHASAANPIPVPARAATDTATYEVQSVVDYIKSRQRDDDTSTREPHYRVHWVGYDSSHDTWLPLAELSGCIEKVADYLFHAASKTQRSALIEQFPRDLRLRLAHMVAQAERTRRPVRRGEAPAVKPLPTSATKQRSTTRKVTRSQTSKAALPAKIECCSCCSRVLPITVNLRDFPAAPR